MGTHRHFLLVGPRSRARTVDPRTLDSIQFKYEIWPGGPKFDTDSRGLKPKAMGLHLVGDRQDTWSFTLHSTALLRYCSTVLLLYCQVTKFLYCSTALLLYCAAALLPTSHFGRKPYHFVNRIVGRKQYYFYCSTALLLYCQLHKISLLRYCQFH